MGWVGLEKLKLMLTQSSCAGAGTELGNITLPEQYTQGNNFVFGPLHL